MTNIPTPPTTDVEPVAPPAFAERMNRFLKWWRKQYWVLIFFCFIFGMAGLLFKGQNEVIARANKIEGRGSTSAQWGMPVQSLFGAPPFLAWSGQNAVVLLFSPTCGHCLKFLPKFLEIQGSQLILVATRSAEDEDLSEVREKFHITQPMYRDAEGDFSTWYGLPMVPRILRVQGDNVRVYSGSEAGLDSLQNGL